METAEDYFKKKFGNELKSNDSWVIRFAQEYAEKHTQQNESNELQRVFEWLQSDNREPAQTKFTAGLTRNIARELEFLLAQQKRTKPKQNCTHPHESVRSKCFDCGEDVTSVTIK